MKCLICDQPTEKKVEYRLPNNPPHYFHFCPKHKEVVRDLSAWFVLDQPIFKAILSDEKQKYENKFGK